MSIHIVTDSSVLFTNPQAIASNPVTILPTQVLVEGHSGPTNPVDLVELIGHQKTPPRVVPPSVTDYAEAYRRISMTHNAIISVHPSRHLSSSYANAQEAASQFSGHLKIFVIDSGGLDAAQGLVVRAALRALGRRESLDDLVRITRGASERVYAVYFTESVHFLHHHEVLSPSHAVLSSMLGVKPILSFEDGYLLPIEKVRTRSQGIERLVEFVTEFTDIEDALIVHHRPTLTESARILQERLASEFPNQHFPSTMYGPTLAATIGAQATGLALLEADF